MAARAGAGEPLWQHCSCGNPDVMQRSCQQLDPRALQLWHHDERSEVAMGRGTGMHTGRKHMAAQVPYMYARLRVLQAAGRLPCSELLDRSLQGRQADEGMVVSGGAEDAGGSQPRLRSAYMTGLQLGAAGSWCCPLRVCYEWPQCGHPIEVSAASCQ